MWDLNSHSWIVSFPELLTFGRLWLGFCVERSQHLAFPVNVLLLLKRPLITLSGKFPALRMGAALT